MVNVVTASSRLNEFNKHVLKIIDTKSLFLQRDWETKLNWSRPEIKQRKSKNSYVPSLYRMQESKKTFQLTRRLNKIFSFC